MPPPQTPTQVFTHREACSKELLEWGSRVAAANSRRPVAL